jgi:hypothetical protein
MAAIEVKCIADMPSPGHGERAAKPIPAPKATSIREKATVTNIPATIAAHETAEDASPPLQRIPASYVSL